MGLFRAYLIAAFSVLAVYTLVTGFNHGWNLIPVFFGDMAAMTWAGQFNTDFMMFLILSALWLSWRHNFTAAGFLIGLAGLFGGMLFLSAYLLIESFRARGDIRVLLLGDERSKAEA